MTVGSLPRPNSDAHQQNEQKAKCQVSFTNDEIHVVVEKPADAAERQRHELAQRQCVQRILATAPSTFDCELSGKGSAPRTKLILQRAMFEKLPLLLDISKSTSNEQQESAQLELPCSVLGFVSLMFLLEGQLKPSALVQGDSDTSLPTQTLLVCSNTASAMKM
jgi:hypothetical protein